MGTTVVNMRGGNTAYDVRIDRRTPWGNPFIIGVDGDRDEVVAKYKVWVLEGLPMATGAVSGHGADARWIREHVHELKGKRLGCWCHPKACHGDVLAELADLSDAA